MMYDELVKRLRELASIPEHCENVADCDQCSKEEICLSFTNKRIIETATQAADAIEELQQIAAHYEETAQEYKAVYRKENNKRIAENRYLYDELTKAVREKLLMTPMRIELQEPPKEET